MIEKPGGQSTVHINAPIPQKRPVLTHRRYGRQIAGDEEGRFGVVGSTGQQLPVGGSHEGSAPKSHIVLTPYPVHCRNVDPIGHSVTTLDQFPGLVLGVRDLRELVLMPANGTGVKK